MVRPTDPLAGSNWSTPGTVAGFVKSAPNAVLMAFASREFQRGRTRALDVGCGAGRNAVPLGRLGWHVTGVDLSWPMLEAAAARVRSEAPAVPLQLVLGQMDALPIRDRCCDLIVAHGIWNLAPSAARFRRAVREAARIAAREAALFVFTFSRHTLPSDAEPLPGEPFVFTQFSGQPQCFLTDTQLLAEMEAVGFVPDPSVPLTEYNRPQPSTLSTGVPVIYEGAFRFTR